ncbi:unnamed protein product, partial [marine sediment metagenome]
QDIYGLARYKLKLGWLHHRKAGLHWEKDELNIS